MDASDPLPLFYKRKTNADRAERCSSSIPHAACQTPLRAHALPPLGADAPTRPMPMLVPMRAHLCEMRTPWHADRQGHACAMRVSTRTHLRHGTRMACACHVRAMRVSTSAHLCHVRT
eukprot:365648-Chlamydomonas_euryale.AAC.2